jgi:FtsZ-interacting cell division protein ZipA
MDAFVLIVVGAIVLVLIVLLALGFWHPARAMEITDRDRHKRWATQAEIEDHDVGEMVEGTNEYRRARGAEEITEGQAQAEATRRQRESIDRARDN